MSHITREDMQRRGLEQANPFDYLDAHEYAIWDFLRENYPGERASAERLYRDMYLRQQQTAAALGDNRIRRARYGLRRIARILNYLTAIKWAVAHCVDRSQGQGVIRPPITVYQAVWFVRDDDRGDA